MKKLKKIESGKVPRMKIDEPDTPFQELDEDVLFGDDEEVLDANMIEKELLSDEDPGVRPKKV
eukprot:UN17437